MGFGSSLDFQTVFARNWAIPDATIAEISAVCSDAVAVALFTSELIGIDAAVNSANDPGVIPWL